MTIENKILESITYLNSDLAVNTMEADRYWPKWDGPWWHMSLLHEMGLTDRIPERIVKAHIDSMNRFKLKIFPIQPEDMPEGVDPYRDSPCHCQLGNVYQVLSKWGVNVDQEIPWLRPWFLKYQMADGGLNCDNEAYLVKDEVPSSMVGTIACFEAVLLYTPREWTAEEKIFLDKGAKFLIDRKLMQGSNTKYNANENISAKEDWLKLCFPRFYLYDILRGLTAILRWAEKTNGSIPHEAIQPAITFMETNFPTGEVKIGRHSYEGAGTIVQLPSGEWLRKQPATLFPLLQEVSRIGNVSPYLTTQWMECQTLIKTLKF